MLASSILLLSAAATSSKTSLPSVAEGVSAYRAYDIEKALLIYAAVLSSPGTKPEDKAQARVETARIQWLVQDRPAAALNELGPELARGRPTCDAAMLAGRILASRSHETEPAEQMGQWARRCIGSNFDLLNLEARTLVKAAAKGKAPQANLSRARAIIKSLPPIAQADGETGRTVMEIGIVSGSGREAFEGWRSALWLGPDGRPQGFPSTGQEIHDAILNGAKVHASDGERLELASILVRAGFATEAAWVARRSRGYLADVSWRKIRAYLKMRSALQRRILEHDRQYALTHREDAGGFKTELTAMLKSAVRDAGLKPDEDPSSQLSSLWGLYAQIGTINGVAGIMIGHAVEDRRFSVEQGGRRASIRYIALDNLISNSFSAWLWDGAAAPGGWAKDGKIIFQIRPVYVKGSVKAATLALHGDAYTAAQKDAREASAGDLERAGKSPLVPLPGLGKRLRLEAVDAVRANDSFPEGTQQFIDFMKTAWWNANLKSSIGAHEGRHILDQVEYPGDHSLGDAELEYRGKISEIRYSDVPRLALSGIVGTDIDPASSHGRANTRIISLYAAWVATHPHEIAGFDSTKAPALQIDRLTDDQIRSIAIQADPETNGAVNNGNDPVAKQ